MELLDRSYTTYVELFDVEYYRDLEMWVRGHSRSLIMVPFESLGTVSIVTMAVSLAISEIFSVKEWSDLEIWRGSIDHMTLVRHCNYSSILYHLRVINEKNLTV